LRQLALVSESSSIDLAEVTRVSAALQKQASRDLSPIWEIDATVDGFQTLEDVPIGYWPMVVKDNIGYDAAGIHLDDGNQPYALISSGEDWSLTASHETLEMLVDPFGNRLIAGDSPMEGQGRVEFLVEVSDPSEAAQFAYTVNSILVSDFYTPNFFDPVASSGVRYSFTGAITEPRQVLKGGYLSWHEPVSNHWWQWQYFGDDPAVFKDLGVLQASQGSLRSQIDRLTEAAAAKARAPKPAVLQGARTAERAHDDSTKARATALRAAIAKVLGTSQTSTPDAPAPKVRRPPRR
jgi:hypothetical protein